MLSDPVSAHEVIVMHASGAIRFVFGVDPEQVVRDFRKRRPIGFRVEEACVKLELGAVIVGQVVAVWRGIGKFSTDLAAHLIPHGHR